MLKIPRYDDETGVAGTWGKAVRMCCFPEGFGCWILFVRKEPRTIVFFDRVILWSQTEAAKIL